jgi:hypothetical protein
VVHPPARGKEWGQKNSPQRRKERKGFLQAADKISRKILPLKILVHLFFDFFFALFASLR